MMALKAIFFLMFVPGLFIGYIPSNSQSTLTFVHLADKV
jgi:hypothetical protein